MSWTNVSNSSVTALIREGVLLFAGSERVGAPPRTRHCCAGYGHRGEGCVHVCVCCQIIVPQRTIFFKYMSKQEF